MPDILEKQKNIEDKLKSISPENKVFWDENTATPKFAKGILSEASSDDPQTIAKNFLDKNNDLLGLDDNLSQRLEVTQTETDKWGASHVFFQQYLNDIPVYQGSTQIHINKQGQVFAYKDYRLAKLDISFEPKLDENAAVKTATDDIESENVTKDYARMCFFRDDDEKPHLAWEMNLVVDGNPVTRKYFVDAHTGKILFKFTRDRQTCSRKTYTANNQNFVPGTILIDNDNPSTANDPVAQAAHDNAKEVCDYYRSNFGRDSYDGKGSTVKSTVHFRMNPDEPYINAAWISDPYNQMIYGDGDGINYGPFSFALDVVGHELTHAVGDKTARFVYVGESGALDESFADFFGVMSSEDGPISDWEVGEDIYLRGARAFRDMSNPERYGDPDHMDNIVKYDRSIPPDSEKNDNYGVHTNSSIPNKAAFLAVAGGTHHGITVNGLGREKTETIYYLGLTSYLFSSTDTEWTFRQARFALLNACRQLYGDAGPEYATIKNAWAAVGVGEPASNFVTATKESSPNLSIPDNDSDGVSDTLSISESGFIKDVEVSLKINHTYISDLFITLVSPAGERAILHQRTGGSSNNIHKQYAIDSLPSLQTYLGDQMNGSWTLHVSDHAGRDVGILKEWALKITAQKSGVQTITKESSPNLSIPDNSSNGVSDTILIENQGKILNIDVTLDVIHTWIGDLNVVLSSASGDDVVIHNNKGRSRHNIKKTYSTKTDDFMRPLIGKTINGDWRLKIVDSAQRDVGVLNSWALKITFE